MYFSMCTFIAHKQLKKKSWNKKTVKIKIKLYVLDSVKDSDL